mgnify:CR=1 FL=1
MNSVVRDYFAVYIKNRFNTLSNDDSGNCKFCEIFYVGLDVPDLGNSVFSRSRLWFVVQGLPGWRQINKKEK